MNPRGSFEPPTRLAGERLRPLGHLSSFRLRRWRQVIRAVRGWAPENRRYRSVGRRGASITIEPTDPTEPDEVPLEAPSRARAWTQIVLISLGIVIVGISLFVVLWLLFTLTTGLLEEVL